MPWVQLFPGWTESLVDMEKYESIPSLGEQNTSCCVFRCLVVFAEVRSVGSTCWAEPRNCLFCRAKTQLWNLGFSTCGNCPISRNALQKKCTGSYLAVWFQQLTEKLAVLLLPQRISHTPFVSVFLQLYISETCQGCHPHFFLEIFFHVFCGHRRPLHPCDD